MTVVKVGIWVEEMFALDVRWERSLFVYEKKMVNNIFHIIQEMTLSLNI